MPIISQRRKSMPAESLRSNPAICRFSLPACRELPLDLQKKVGPLPDGFLTYFAARWALSWLVMAAASVPVAALLG